MNIILMIYNNETSLDSVNWSLYQYSCKMQFLILFVKEGAQKDKSAYSPWKS